MRERAAKNIWVSGLLVLALSVCAGAFGQPTPGWALGEQPNFSGIIPNWADGDALRPGAGNIFANAEMGSGEEIDVGVGTVDAAGNFTFGLTTGAALAFRPGAEAFCDGLDLNVSASNPSQFVALVGLIEVPALLTEGQHARPKGGLIIRRSPPTGNSLVEQYGFLYADSDGTVRGNCSGEGLTVTLDLDLRKGWNSVYLGPGFDIITAAIPDDADWYFVNAVVLNK